MKRTLLSMILLASSSFAAVPAAYAKGYGSSAGLTMQQTSARAAALGEAFTAAIADVSAMNHNPAVLGTMKTHRVLFSYEEGLIGDAMTQVILGSPFFRKGGMGFKIEHYDAGKLTLDNNQTVTAQRDFILSVGGGLQLNKMSLGATGKYLTSTLAETASAQAFALDFGIDVRLSPKVYWGSSVQNIGTALKYVERNEPLPRSARTGFAFSFAPAATRTTVFLDAQYLLNEKITQPSLGVETLFGPLAMRGGFKKEQDNNVFSIGTGLAWGPSMIDYSFGLSGEEKNNKVSFSLLFGGPSGPPDFESNRGRFEQEIQTAGVFDIRDDKKNSEVPSTSVTNSASPGTNGVKASGKPGAPETLGSLATSHKKTIKKTKPGIAKTRATAPSSTGIRKGQKSVRKTKKGTRTLPRLTAATTTSSIR